MRQIFVVVMTILFLGGCATQNSPEKEAAKAAEEAREMALYEQAVKALESKDFVLETDRIDFRRGNFLYVQPSTNFVALNDNRATVQLAFNGARSGPNGIGGITVEGLTTGLEMEKDKKGNINFSMMVQGTGISAQVTFRMIKGSNKCTATVLPNFSSNRITFTGYIYPTEESNVFKGRVL